MAYLAPSGILYGKAVTPEEKAAARAWLTENYISRPGFVGCPEGVNEATLSNFDDPLALLEWVTAQEDGELIGVGVISVHPLQYPDTHAWVFAGSYPEELRGEMANAYVRELAWPEGCCSHEALTIYVAELGLPDLPVDVDNSEVTQSGVEFHLLRIAVSDDWITTVKAQSNAS